MRLLTGSGAFTDTLNRSGSSAATGTLIGNSLSLTFVDFDRQCGGRMFTNTATVTSTTSGCTSRVPARSVLPTPNSPYERDGFV